MSEKPLDMVRIELAVTNLLRGADEGVALGKGQVGLAVGGSPICVLA